VAVLASSLLHSEHGAATNACEAAIGKFVSSFGVLSIALVDSQMPFCVFTEPMLSNELVLKLNRSLVSIQFETATEDRGVSVRIC